MIEDRDPVAKEKDITPIIIIIIDNPLSRTFSACKSPYPTVVIVAIVK